MCISTSELTGDRLGQICCWGFKFSILCLLTPRDRCSFECCAKAHVALRFRCRRCRIWRSLWFVEPKDACESWRARLTFRAELRRFRRVLKGQGFLDHFMKNSKPIMEPKIAKKPKTKAVEKKKKKKLTMSDLAAINLAELGFDPGPSDPEGAVPAQVLCEHAEAAMVASRTAIEEAGAFFFSVT